MKPLFPDVFVNGEKIPSAAIAAEAQNHKAPADKPGLAWHAAARVLVVRKLLLQEVLRKGLEAAPRSLGPDKAETEEEALIRAYLDTNLQPDMVTEDEVKAAVERFKGNEDVTENNMRDQLEKIAWTRAANILVNQLVDQAKITGTEMNPAKAA
jgi:hypothetical protein